MSLILPFILLLDYALALVLMAGRRISKNRAACLPLIAALVTMAAAGLLAGYSTLYLLSSGAFALLAAMLALAYFGAARKFLLLLALVALQLVYIAFLGIPITKAFTAGFAIGTFFGVFFLERTTGRANIKRKGKRLEIDRDLFQVLLGAIVLILLLLSRAWFAYVTIPLILLAYAYNSVARYFRSGPLARVSRFLRGFERKDAVYGAGALYLAVGFLLLLSFVTSYKILTFGVAILFFSDSAATIIGKKFGMRRLPYNSSKSLGGFLAFFAVSAAAGLLTLNSLPLALAAALALALLESVDLHVDDNVLLAIGVIAIYAFMHV